MQDLDLSEATEGLRIDLGVLASGDPDYDLDEMVNDHGPLIAVTAVGDVNGDGIDDFVIGSPEHRHSANEDAYTLTDLHGGEGRAFVIFGSEGGFGTNTATINEIVGATISSSTPMERLGSDVVGDVDLNGDGIDDLVIGAAGSYYVTNSYPGIGRADQAAAYVIFGASGLQDVDVDGYTSYADSFDDPGAPVALNHGHAAGMGQYVSVADIDGDGNGDVILSGRDFLAPADQSGTVYYASGGRAEIPSNTDGYGSFYIRGFHGSVGDVNGDGLDDILVGDATLLMSNGIGSPLADTIDLSTRFPAMGGASPAAAAGDVNDDGYDDFTFVGGKHTYIVFGGANGPSSDAQIVSQAMLRAAAGDVDNDGIDDLLLASGSTAYVVLGKQNFADGFNINNLGDRGFRIILPEDVVIAALARAGDIDGDGVEDFIFGAYDRDALSANMYAFVAFGGSAVGAAIDDDTLVGSDAGDAFSGLGGDDRIDGGGGNDTLSGDGGSDTLIGGGGDDQLYGGSGNDVLTPGAGHDTLFGGAGTDVADFGGFGIGSLWFSLVVPEPLRADPPGTVTDALIAGGVMLVRNGLTGAIVRLNDDIEILRTDNGDVPLEGIVGPAEALLEMRAGTDGGDVMAGSALSERLVGGLGRDSLEGGGGDDQLIGDWIGNRSASDGDTLKGGEGNDRTWGQNGDDELFGGNGDDSLFGNLGHDTLMGGDGDDVMRAHLGNDSLVGEAGLDLVFAGAGEDTVLGDIGSDTLNGSVGNDSIQGGAGDDTLRGQAGLDTVRGGDGDDNIVGMQASDRLFGDAGNDTITGGQADDTMTGGAGADIFVFADLQGANTITDFAVNTDKISLVVSDVGVSGFADLTIVNSGGNAVITFEALPTTQITLSDVAAGTLNADDFFFS